MSTPKHFHQHIKSCFFLILGTNEITYNTKYNYVIDCRNFWLVHALKCILRVLSECEHSKPIPFWKLETMYGLSEIKPPREKFQIPMDYEHQLVLHVIFIYIETVTTSAFFCKSFGAVLGHPRGGPLRNSWNFHDPIISSGWAIHYPQKAVCVDEINLYNSDKYFLWEASIGGKKLTPGTTPGRVRWVSNPTVTRPASPPFLIWNMKVKQMKPVLRHHINESVDFLINLTMTLMITF